MRFVPLKTVERQDSQAVHRMRSRLIGAVFIWGITSLYYVHPNGSEMPINQTDTLPIVFDRGAVIGREFTKGFLSGHLALSLWSSGVPLVSSSLDHSLVGYTGKRRCA